MKDKYFVRGAYDNRAYVLEVEYKDLTVEILTKFADDLLANKLLPTPFNSEPIPETNDGPIFKVVARNHEQIVRDATKFVFMEYFTPTCGYCQRLAPVYEELARHFQGQKDLVIGAMDMSLNDILTEDVHSYPTLIFYNKEGEAIRYFGDKEIEEMKAFVNNEIEAAKAKEKAKLSVKDDL